MSKATTEKFGIAAQIALGSRAISKPPPINKGEDAPVDQAAEDAKRSDSTSNESRNTEHSDHTNHTQRRRTAIKKKKKPGAPSREGGYVRRTITLAPTLSDYVDAAWRTYRGPDGRYVKGVSGFIEAVVAEHRAKRT